MENTLYNNCIVSFFSSRTILYVSLIYGLGNVVVSFSDRTFSMREGGPEGLTNFSKKISWLSIFFGKYFMACPISFSFLFKTCLP